MAHRTGHLQGSEESVRTQGISAFASERRLPCDVAQRLERSSRDFATLTRYARQLDADVIALQEVDGIEAARLVFPGYEFCFSGSRHLQNTGFAIRAGLPKRCAPDVTDLSLGDTVRRGAELVLFPGEPREVHLLSVHLKSGCSSKPLNSGEKACDTLARQTPILERWIDAQAGRAVDSPYSETSTAPCAGGWARPFGWRTARGPVARDRRW